MQTHMCLYLSLSLLDKEQEALTKMMYDYNPWGQSGLKSCGNLWDSGKLMIALL